MSKHEVKVIRIGQIDKHPDADALEVVHVWGYTCCARIGDFHVGELAAFVEPDTMVPVSQPEFAFLSSQAQDGMVRIRAKRLRGVQSFGLLMHARAHWEEGADVAEELGCGHWEPPPAAGGLDAHGPDVHVVKYDVESMRRFDAVIRDGDPVEITEKINGENARFVFTGGALHVGSPTRWKVRDKSVAWWVAAERLGLEEKLARYPDHVFYGELYGGVGGFDYGVPKGERRLVFFDIMHNAEWLPPQTACGICAELGLSWVPVLHVGPWEKKLARLADGRTVLGGEAHIREGCVVKPLTPRHNKECGRVVLKLVSLDYLEGKRRK